MQHQQKQKICLPLFPADTLQTPCRTCTASMPGCGFGGLIPEGLINSAQLSFPTSDPRETKPIQRGNLNTRLKSHMLPYAFICLWTIWYPLRLSLSQALGLLICISAGASDGERQVVELKAPNWSGVTQWSCHLEGVCSRAGHTTHHPPCVVSQWHSLPETKRAGL